MPDTLPQRLTALKQQHAQLVQELTQVEQRRASVTVEPPQSSDAR